jgi:hypothetical protein
MGSLQTNYFSDRKNKFCQNFVLKFVGVAKTDGPAFNDG